MTNRLENAALKPFAPGILLALLAILFGFGLGIAFGAAEDTLKKALADSGAAVLDSVYGGDSEKMDAVVSKSWSYLKRAHLHAGAIGTSALATALLLFLIGTPGKLERWSSSAFGAGALLYSIFWCAAGFLAPGLGGTSQAKESLEFLAIPGSAFAVLGLVGAIVSVVRRVVFAPK